MRCVIDIECNSLNNPIHIWLIVCKDIETGELHIFREVTSDEAERQRFLAFSRMVTAWIGHNILGYDLPALANLLGLASEASTIDTLVVSKLVNYERPEGHSLGSYGEELGRPKGDFSDWTKYSKEMEEYCINDVELSNLLYNKFAAYCNDPVFHPALSLEHDFQRVVNDLHNNGFSFNSKRCAVLLATVKEELSLLDKDILREFPPKLKLVREITPKVTKHGTLSKSDFRWVEDGDLSIYNGGPFCKCVWSTFNPSSHKQLIEVLDDAGWSPVEKTKTHIDTERELNRLKYSPDHKDLDIKLLRDKLQVLQKTGWKINEANLNTLPVDAPTPARTLAKRILLESRRRTLTEWLNLVVDGRIHGKFYGIGAWTHRMAHQQPNTANIPNEFKTDGSVNLLGKDMRSLWQAPRNRLLCGVDAEGIQLRIFAHYIDDEEFTNALVAGKKTNKSDPHSLNQRVLGPVCRSRQVAKRFVYALLLGAGIGKLAEILATSEDEARGALDRLMERYQGFTYLKEHIIPADAKRGWFRGLDGRTVRIPGVTTGQRKHLCMSGYLQNGEAIAMKKATLKAYHILKETNSKLVDLVHDEWQIETPNDMEKAVLVAETFSWSLREVGEELKLKCPLAGSYWSEDHNDYTIGTNWSVTH